MKLVSIVMINFNGLRDLPGCLESVKGQDYADIELIIVDNRSDDGSREFLEGFARDPEGRDRFYDGSPVLILNEENRGFSRALNQGIEPARGEFIMSMNTDVVLEPGFVSALVSVMGDPEVGSATGKLLRFPPGGDGVIDSAGHVIYRNRLAVNRGEGKPGTTSYNEPGRVFGACGAAAMYRRSMLEDVRVEGEYFDEDFFAFWEDLDLDWRAALRGWKCVYNPEALGYHRRGGAGYRKSLPVEFHNYKNRYLMVMKNDSGRFILRNLPGILPTEVLKGGALLIRCPGALLALVRVLRLAPRMIRKRRIIQSRRTVPSREFEPWFQAFPYRSWIKMHAVYRGDMIAMAKRDRR